MSRVEYEVVPYSGDELCRTIAELSGGGPSSVGMYLDGYALKLGCKTLVVEPDYVDGDYLDDYAAYYSRCFRPFLRHCWRIHLFAFEFQEAALDTAIFSAEEAASKDFVDSYLGFVVVRPLRNAPIGRTALKVYPDDMQRRRYTVLRMYEANLFGLRLKVKSLAYQQQDSVVAACATVSLWCAFHQTSRLYHSRLPRPAEITGLASKASTPGRVFPNHGLDLRQICDAVRAVGLEPEVFQVSAGTYLQSLLYAHLAAGIPVVVCAEIEGEDHHAFTVTGWSKSATPRLTDEISESPALPMSGRSIEAFYVHDDGIGPFARLDLHRAPIGRIDRTYFAGTWKDKDGSDRRIIPWAVLVPVYNKIRVNFIDVQKLVLRLHNLFGPIVEVILDGQPEWDIQLVTVNDYKERIRQNPKLSVEDKEGLLLSPQPKYIWKSNLTVDGTTALQILGDATGVSGELPFYRAIWYDGKMKAAVTLTLSKFPRKSLLDSLTAPLLEFIQTELRR